MGGRGGEGGKGGEGGEGEEGRREGKGERYMEIGREGRGEGWEGEEGREGREGRERRGEGRARRKIHGDREGRELQADSVCVRETPTNSGALKNELQPQPHGALSCHNAANPVAPRTGVSETGLHQTKTFIDHLRVLIVQKLKDLVSEPRLSGDRCMSTRKLHKHCMYCSVLLPLG